METDALLTYIIEDFTPEEVWDIGLLTLMRPYQSYEPIKILRLVASWQRLYAENKQLRAALVILPRNIEEGV